MTEIDHASKLDRFVTARHRSESLDDGVLFVCQYNVGRSQIAEALCHAQAMRLQVASAGLTVDSDGQSLRSYQQEHPQNYFTPDVMRSMGFDILKQRRRQVTPSIARAFRHVVCMAEKKATPIWLVRHPGYVYWNVPDPGGRSYEETLATAHDIDGRVKDFISREQESSHTCADAP